MAKQHRGNGHIEHGGFYYKTKQNAIFKTDRKHHESSILNISNFNSVHTVSLRS